MSKKKTALAGSGPTWKCPEPSLSPEHIAKLATSALPADVMARLHWRSLSDGRLEIDYLKPDGQPETCADGEPFRRHRSTAAAIANGAPLTIDRDNDKNPVVALRELADSTVVPEDLRETVIVALQRVDERTEAEDEAEIVGLLAEPQHMNMAEAELIRALQSDRDGGQEERY